MGTGTITSAMTGSNFYMFQIASGGAVTLDGATIDGNNTAFAVETVVALPCFVALLKTVRQNLHLEITA